MNESNSHQNISDKDILDRSVSSGLSVQEETCLALEKGEIPGRYQRNILSLSPAEQMRLARSRLLVVGCGGLGGSLLECLVRTGVGKIVACDPDIFEESNLNRQILATTRTMGQKKAEAVRDRALEINPLVEVEAVCGPVKPNMLNNMQAVADCLGGSEHRFELQEMAKNEGIPLVSAGIAGWHALVCCTWPGEAGLGEFMEGSRQSVEKEQGVLCPVASFAASIQTAELIKILTGETPALRGSLLIADLAQMRFSTVDLRTGQA